MWCVFREGRGGDLVVLSYPSASEIGSDKRNGLWTWSRKMKYYKIGICCLFADSIKEHQKTYLQDPEMINNINIF
jgi:hypothetical protein